MKKLNLTHQTHTKTLLKFTALVAILFGYFLYMSWKYDVSTGFSAALLTWCFFVLCTPIADGGFILAFPIRLLFGIKMIVSQIVLWFVAIGISIFILISTPSAYELTFLTQLLHRILTEPYPYWSILLISAMGTFLSIFFGDEIMDISSRKGKGFSHKHKSKYRTIFILGLGILTIIAYYNLLSSLDITLPKS